MSDYKPHISTGNTAKSVTKVLQDGRVTVPHQVREMFDLEPGDYVEITVKPVMEAKDD